MRRRIAAMLLAANGIAIASAGQLHTLEERIQRRNQPDAPLIEERSPSDFVYDMATVLQHARRHTAANRREALWRRIDLHAAR